MRVHPPHSRGMGGETKLTGPDLEQGVALTDMTDGGMLLGHAHGEAVLLARRGAGVFAVGATCSHYGGPLAEGLVVGEEVRCPWHHACFSLRTGEPLRGPGLGAIPCFDVAVRDGKIHVLGKRDAETVRLADGGPSSIVIVGAGPAGNACAEALRRERYAGPIALIGAEETGPVDRPNLSKDYLAGNAPEEWIPLRGDDFYREHEVELVKGTRVVAIDVARKHVELEGAGRARTELSSSRRAPHPRSRRSRGSTRRMSSRCARWPTAAPSSPGPRPRSARC